jgi:hypothetical protein
LLIPRGLITAVLALEVIRVMPQALGFLTPLTFAVILLTNILVLLAAFRASGAAEAGLEDVAAPAVAPAAALQANAIPAGEPAIQLDAKELPRVENP